MIGVMFPDESPLARFYRGQAGYHWREAWRGSRWPRWRHLQLAVRYRLRWVFA